MKSKYAPIILCLFVVVGANAGFTQDKWNGGTGNWSNAVDWSAGLPGAGSDVVIYSGGNDLVYLDTSPTINSLTIGGNNGYYHELTDNGSFQTLTINVSLEIGQPSSYLYLYGGTAVSAGADSINAGFLDLYSGSSVSVTGNLDNRGYAYISGGAINTTGTFTNEAGANFVLNNPGDVANLGALANNGYLLVNPGASLIVAGGPTVTDILLSATYSVYGTFTIGGGDPFASLNSIERNLYLYGQTTNMTPPNGTLTLGTYANLSADNSSSLKVNGNVVNDGLISSGSNGSGFNSLNISGTLTNNGRIRLSGSGDVANVGTLVNNGFVSVARGVTLNLTSQPLGITDVAYGSIYYIYGAFNAGANSAFANLTSIEGTVSLDNGQATSITPGGGVLSLNGQTSQLSANLVTINGDVKNSGYVGLGTTNITGAFTNEQSGKLEAGPVVNIGTLTNSGWVSLGPVSSVHAAQGYYQLSSGTLGEGIGESGDAIVVVADGSVMLAGTLDILLDPGFFPGLGSTYRFLLFTPGELSGTFDQVLNDTFNNHSEAWLIIYDNTDGYVELEAVTATPEPASLLLLGTGLIGAVAVTRRKINL